MRRGEVQLFRIHPIQLAVPQRRGAVVGQPGHLLGRHLQAIQIVVAAERDEAAVGRELGVALHFRGGRELLPFARLRMQQKQVAFTLISISCPVADHWKLCSETRRFCQSTPSDLGGFTAFSSSGPSATSCFCFLEATSYCEMALSSIHANRFPSGAQVMAAMRGGAGIFWMVTGFFSAAKPAQRQQQDATDPLHKPALYPQPAPPSRIAGRLWHAKSISMEFVSGNIGWIEVICGPMFSGKSEELIRRLRRAMIARKRVQVFKPVIDTRYSRRRNRFAWRSAHEVRSGEPPAVRFWTAWTGARKSSAWTRRISWARAWWTSPSAWPIAASR